ALGSTIQSIDFSIRCALVGCLHEPPRLVEIRPTPRLQLYPDRCPHRRVLTVQVKAQELAPIGPKPLTLECGHQPGMVHGHTRAFDSDYALLAESGHGGVQEAL